MFSIIYCPVTIYSYPKTNYLLEKKKKSKETKYPTKTISLLMDSYKKIMGLDQNTFDLEF